MASTSSATNEAIRPLTAADLPGALALSQSANWNQNEADWRGMLALGEGYGIEAADEHGVAQLAASCVVLPYGERFAWVSMVLVLPNFQRRGYASRLLRHALDGLAARGRAAVLDATPAGHAVYVQEGFADTWGFARYRREAGLQAPASPDGPPTRAILKTDWPAIAALDLPAFGADRLPLLQTLAQRWPGAARVLEAEGRVVGYAFGRDGREAHQIGPLVCLDPAHAPALLASALQTAPGAVYVDLLDSRAALLPWLQAQGFALQRPFTRMVCGTALAPGDARTVVLAAGPELG